MSIPSTALPATSPYRFSPFLRQGSHMVLQAATFLSSETEWLTLVLGYKTPKRSIAGGGLFFLAPVQPASHPLKVNTFFPYIENLYSDATNMQSTNPMLFPICIAETQRSTAPDGCFTSNCANMKCKESSCPRICQEIAHRDGRMLVQTETSNLGTPAD